MTLLTITSSFNGLHVPYHWVFYFTFLERFVSYNMLLSGGQHGGVDYPDFGDRDADRLREAKGLG